MNGAGRAHGEAPADGLSVCLPGGELRDLPVNKTNTGDILGTISIPISHENAFLQYTGLVPESFLTDVISNRSRPACLFPDR